MTEATRDWLHDFINQQPIHEALQIVGGIMLEDHLSETEAIAVALTEIPSTRRKLFAQIMDLHRAGKTVAEIADSLLAAKWAKAVDR